MTLFEFVNEQKAVLQKEAKLLAAKARNKNDHFEFIPLVPDNLLVFRVLSNAAAMGAPASGVGDTFRQVFNKVWQSIPEPERQCMLDYWRRPTPMSASDWIAPPRKPVIQVVDLGSCSSSFPLCAATGNQ